MANKLSNLKIGEVSLCRKGMNKHARVGLFKSADGTETGIATVAVIKATFDEALEGNMIAGAVNDAFYESFNGLWERNDAFRTALTDELASGGDGSVASEAYVASVKGLVDSAVASAREAGATAADTAPIEGAVSDAVEKWLSERVFTKEHDMNIKTRAELLASVAKFDPTKNTVADADAIRKAATDLSAEDALPMAGPLAKAAADPNADLVRKIAVLEMPVEVRKHFDALDAAAQTGFLAKSAEDRAAEVAKANEGDPVVYTTTDGIDIRKSDGRTAELLARSNDKLSKQVADLTKTSAETSLEARAAAFPNVAKAVAVDMLKSIDTLGADSTGGKAVATSLATMNKASGGLFKAIGTDETPAGEGNLVKAKADFNAVVNKIAERDSVAKSVAMEKARTEEPEAWAAAFPAEAAAAERAASEA
jgi:hypothetical protein